MDIEKTREEYNRLLNDLARMMADDPNYAKTLEAAEKLARIIGEYERRDLDRINSNVKNDISEDELRVDMAKVKTDRLREWLGLVKTALGVGASVGMGLIAYKGDVIDFKLPIRNLWDLAKGVIPKRSCLRETGVQPVSYFYLVYIIYNLLNEKKTKLFGG